MEFADGIGRFAESVIVNERSFVIGFLILIWTLKVTAISDGADMESHGRFAGMMHLLVPVVAVPQARTEVKLGQVVFRRALQMLMALAMPCYAFSVAF